MNVAIRVDAATWIGTGHLKRCIALADALVSAGASVRMVCRRLDDVALAVLEPSGLPTIWLELPKASTETLVAVPALPQYHAWARVDWQIDAQETVEAVSKDTKPDWMVVDHYAFDARWHRAIRKSVGCSLAVIDDVADRDLDADVLVDHNAADDHYAKYARRIKSGTPVLGGPRYALLDEAYARAPKYEFNSEVRSIGVFMGGTDLGSISSRIVESCRMAAQFAGPIEVVSSSVNPHLGELRQVCAAWPDTVLTIDLPHLANFFSAHDIQIGAGGGATWERCCVGVPTIALSIADNQQQVVTLLAQRGVLRQATVGSSSTSADRAPTEPLPQALRALMADAGARKSLIERAASLVDGRGAQRVALWLLRDTLQLRRAVEPDAPLLHQWRNHASVRAVSVDPRAIPYSEHAQWVQKVLRDANRFLLIAQVQNVPVGCIRFDRAGACDGIARMEVSIFLDPQLQGLGFGSRLLLCGEQWLQACVGTPLQVEGTVMSGNTASQRLFEGCQYEGGPEAYKKHLKAHYPKLAGPTS